MQITNVWDGRKAIITNPTGIIMVIGKYYEQRYANKVDNRWNEQILWKIQLTKIDTEETENLNNLYFIKKLNFTIRSLPQRKPYA